MVMGIRYRSRDEKTPVVRFGKRGRRKDKRKLSSSDAFPLSAVLFNIHRFCSGLDEILVLQSQVLGASRAPSGGESTGTVMDTVDDGHPTRRSRRGADRRR
jgi:hypothetical protein